MSALAEGRDAGLSGAVVIVTGGVGKAVVAKLLAAGAHVCAADVDAAVNDLARHRQCGGVHHLSGRRHSCGGHRPHLHPCGGGLRRHRLRGQQRRDHRHQVRPRHDRGRVGQSARHQCQVVVPDAQTSTAGHDRARRGLDRGDGVDSSIVGLPTEAAYAASKGAVLQLVRQTAVEYAGTGVRINAVGPGSIARTKILDTYLGGLDDAEAGAVDMFVKDLGIVLEAGRDAKAALPLAAAAHQLFLASSGRGEGTADDSQVIRSYALLNGTRKPA